VGTFKNTDKEMSEQGQIDRVLIVNADDFGQTAAITRGILRAHQHGIVTSTSLMVRGPAAAFAVEHAGDLDLGLHIDLGEWAYRDGAWVAVYERVRLDDVSAVEDEIDFQLNEFRRLTGKLPSHLDSHQHVHISEPVLWIAKQFADELDVPLRGCSPAVRYCGAFYGQTGKGEPYPEAISVSALIKLVRDLPIGVTEVASHPGEADQNDQSTYGWERSLELQTLCHPQVRDSIRKERIHLNAFAELANNCAKIEQPAPR
jgi:chitin disaccharide deacetylase